MAGLSAFNTGLGSRYDVEQRILLAKEKGARTLTLTPCYYYGGRPGDRTRDQRSIH